MRDIERLPGARTFPSQPHRIVRVRHPKLSSRRIPEGPRI